MSDYKGKPVAINVKPPPFTVKLQISFNVFSNFSCCCISNVLWWYFPEIPILSCIRYLIKTKGCDFSTMTFQFYCKWHVVLNKAFRKLYYNSINLTRENCKFLRKSPSYPVVITPLLFIKSKSSVCRRPVWVVAVQIFIDPLNPA